MWFVTLQALNQVSCLKNNRMQNEQGIVIGQKCLLPCDFKLCFEVAFEPDHLLIR